MDQNFSDKQLYLVEFGIPHRPNSYGFGGSIKSYYIVASSYDEAGCKAMKFHEENKSSNSVIDYDGSLRTNDDMDCMKSIQLISTLII